LVGQTQIEKNHVGWVGPNLLKSSRPGGGYIDSMGGSGKGLTHLLWNQAGIIID